MRCLVIDNYDSFTWNLQQDIAQVFGVEPTVLRNDELSWQQLEPDLAAFACVVISPGPGTPANPADVGLSYPLAQQQQLPVLGVCLGFQLLLQQSGGKVQHAPQPYHGRLSAVYHRQQDLLAGIPSPFEVVRYHSLCLPPNLPLPWLLTAQTADGIPMAASHRSQAKWGVQFHPESILTQHGQTIMRNYRRLVQQRQALTEFAAKPSKLISIPANNASSDQRRPALQLIGQAVKLPLSPEQVFQHCYGSEQYAFWLDNAAPQAPQDSYSFIGAVQESAVLRYSLAQDDAQLSQGQAFLQQLDQELNAIEVQTQLELPFAFRGGLVGCFSYEIKALFGGQHQYSNQHDDACWLRVTRFIAYDHQQEQFWLLALEQDSRGLSAQDWLEQTAQQLQQLALSLEPAAADSTTAATTGALLDWDSLQLQLSLPTAGYHQAVQRCRQLIKDGESYEICLTNRFDLPQPKLAPLALYQRLRQTNPAPWAAYLQFDQWQALSSSPELFLQVNAAGQVISKPIKGTAARSSNPLQDQLAKQQLQHSEKDRAENLMIVDLVRNDLARVCQTGTVSVPQLLQIESFTSVHQLVSTVQGQLKPQSSLLDLLQASFPAGSITGAPKIRTMQIIDQLEPKARGLFCGCIGYLGYNRVAQLNVAIRSLVCQQQQISGGAGGAITYLSDSAQEWDELVLKANAVLRSLG